MKKKILDTIEDLVVDFLYYDRKEDEDLPRGVIEKAILNREISIEEILEKFRQELVKAI